MAIRPIKIKKGWLEIDTLQDYEIQKKCYCKGQIIICNKIT